MSSSLKFAQKEIIKYLKLHFEFSSTCKNNKDEPVSIQTVDGTWKNLEAFTGCKKNQGEGKGTFLKYQASLLITNLNTNGQTYSPAFKVAFVKIKYLKKNIRVIPSIIVGYSKHFNLYLHKLKVAGQIDLAYKPFYFNTSEATQRIIRLKGYQRICLGSTTNMQKNLKSWKSILIAR